MRSQPSRGGAGRRPETIEDGIREERIIGVALAAAATASAFAQNSTTATTAPASAMTAPMGGMQTADLASAQVKFATVSPADVMPSKLVGLDVYKNQNEKLGQRSGTSPSTTARRSPAWS